MSSLHHPLNTLLYWLNSTNNNYLLTYSPITIFIVLILGWLLRLASRKYPSPQPRSHDGASGKIPPITPLEYITPTSLPKVKPLPFRPYKPAKYHLTMGLSKLPAPYNDLIQIDSGYPERIALRRELLGKYEDAVLGFDKEGEEAVREMYINLLGTHLPARYPGLFKVLENKSSGNQEFYNLVLDTVYPITENLSTREMLRNLALTIEEDLLFLLPTCLDSNSMYKQNENGKEEKEVYVLKAFEMLFPSGFSITSKLNLPLRKIHTPVPGYETKLANSMDRFFEKIEAGKGWRRWNWTVTLPRKQLFNVPLLPAPSSPSDAAEKSETWNPDDANLRVEYQTLIRLPGTKAVVFSVRTYLTGLREITHPEKDNDGEEYGRRFEGVGPFEDGENKKGAEELAIAIEGLISEEGNSELARYKGAVGEGGWAERVIGYLRNEMG